jgi:hypothetical protein
MTQDEEHLRLLSIFHYVLGGFSAFFALFPVIYLILGLVFILAPGSFGDKGEPPPAFVGWFLVIFGIAFITVGWIFAAFVFTTGRFLGRRRHYLFCLVMAGVECIFMPLGTILGVFTIIVLMRESVKALFAADHPAAQDSPSASG